MTILKSNLINNGINLHNDKPTFKREIYTSQFDVIFCNWPQKISNISQNDDLDSDHSSISCKRNIKLNSAEDKLILVRYLNNIEPVNINYKILTHVKYQSTLLSPDANVICENIISILSDVFNNLSPKKIKIQKNYKKLNQIKNLRIWLILRTKHIRLW